MRQQKNYEVSAIISQKEPGFAVVGKTAYEAGWQKNPTSSFARRAYLHPERPLHGVILRKHILTEGFGITHKTGQKSTDSNWSIDWLEGDRQAEHQLIAQVFKLVLDSTKAGLSSEEYSKNTLPKVWSLLSQSTLYRAIFAKTSARQGTSIEEHIKLVPEKVNTDDLPAINVLILRLAAILHDIMKAFETGGDQIYHSLGGAKLIEDFFDNMQVQLESLLSDQSLNIASDADQLLPPSGDPKQRFSYLRTQVVQIVRLHHVFEMVDKGLITSEELHEICLKSGVNPSLLARFIAADGLSVVEASPTQEVAIRYSKYLAANTEFAVRLCFEMGETPEILLTCVALQKLFYELLEKIEDLYEAFQEFLQKNGLILLELIGSEKPNNGQITAWATS